MELTNQMHRLTPALLLMGEEDLCKMDAFGASTDKFIEKSFGDATDMKASEMPEGKAGFFSGFVNLLKTILGSGMLSLPLAISSIGAILGLLLSVLAAALSAFGLHLLSVCAEKIGRKSSVYALCQITYPKISLLFDGAVVIKCFGVACTYMVVIRNLMPAVAIALGAQEGSVATSPILYLTIFHFLVAPLAFLKKVDKLKYTSFVGLIGVFYMVGLAIGIFFTLPKSPDFQLVAPFSITSMKQFGIFIFSFTCHQNLFPIKNEARNNSVRKMDLLIAVCIFLSLLIYSSFGLLCYSVYGSESQKNIFLNFPIYEPQFVVARFIFVFLMACSYPLQTHPCTVSVERILPVPAETMEKYGFYIEKLITLCILLLTYLVSFFFDDLSYLTSLVGSTASVLICYILPFVFYYKIHEDTPWGVTKIAALLMAILGIVGIPFFIVIFFL